MWYTGDETDICIYSREPISKEIIIAKRIILLVEGLYNSLLGAPFLVNSFLLSVRRYTGRRDA